MGGISNNSTAPSESTVKKTDAPIKKSYNNVLTGIIGNTWNAGICNPIAYKKVYAGTKIKKYTISGQIRMNTPVAPLATKLTTTFKAFMVPNSAVWDEAEKFSAQKGTALTNNVIREVNIPFQNKRITIDGKEINLVDTTLWRDSFASSYLPRMATSQSETSTINISVSALPLRGYNEIYNKYLRHKELDPEVPTWKTSTVSAQELETLLPDTNIDLRHKSDKKRGKKRNNYFTNIRTSLTGKLTEKYKDAFNDDHQPLAFHTEWQKTIAEARQQAENEQLNDWEIIAKLRGSRKADQGKVQLIGMAEVGHNYSQVAQTTYNEATPNENFQSLGTTGAYSYTEFSIDIINYEEIIEDGYIHIIAQTSADTIFSTGINRELLNLNWDEQYRPELAELKDDVLKEVEIYTNDYSDTRNSIGYKRKFSEAFELPKHIAGDLTPNGFFEIDENQKIPSEAFWLCQENNMLHKANDETTFQTNWWRDNTDILLNETMALKQPIAKVDTSNDYRLIGKNQFRMIAKTSMIADLPIDNRIKDDFKAQGEV